MKKNNFLIGFSIYIFIMSLFVLAVEKNWIGTVIERDNTKKVMADKEKQIPFCEELLREKENGMNIYVNISNKVSQYNGGTIEGYFDSCLERNILGFARITCFKEPPPKDWMYIPNLSKHFLNINRTMAGDIYDIDDLIKENGCE